MNGKLPLLSIIIPVLDGANTLADAIASILCQEGADMEIIVVDDGSTDDCAAVVRTFGPGVTYVWQENQGPAAARNHGLRLAHGEFVSFLDADDRWPTGRVRYHMEIFTRKPETGIVIGPTQMVNSDPVTAKAPRPMLPAPLIQHQLGSATYRRNTFGCVGLFDPSLRLGEDQQWFQRAIACGVTITMTRAVALEYHIRPGSLTYGAIDPKHGFLAALRADLHNRRGG